MKLRADKTLLGMAKTFRVKNKRYGDNWEVVGRVFMALYPKGMVLKTESDFVVFHWLSWKIGKMTRFVQTNHTHVDSVHDDAVYTAMIETYIKQKKENKQHERKIRYK